MYSFALYSDKTKNDWFSIASQENAVWINALECEALQKNSPYNIIVYKQKCEDTKIPIAIFVANGLENRFNGFIKILDAVFGGLFVAQKFWDEAWEIKSFFYEAVVIGYYAKKLSIDYINFLNAPLVSIEKREQVVICNPTYYAYVNNNTIVYTLLEGEFIQQLKQNSRYEIRKGMKFLEKNIVLNSKLDVVKHFHWLDHYKATSLSISKMPDNYFSDKLASRYYKSLVCLDKESLSPLCCVIYSVNGQIANFEYNSSTDTGKKTYANKALLYQAMQDSKFLGAKYFVLGNGYVEYGNMKAVTVFKKSMSTHESPSSIFKGPISLKGRVFITAMLFRH